MSQWLGSVKNADEAQLLLNSSVDIIDAKDPHNGPLGALPISIVRSIVETIDKQRVISATIGDTSSIPPEKINHAVQEMSSTGVDYVKIGFFPSPDLSRYLEQLAQISKTYSLIAVLFAEHTLEPGLLQKIAQAKFSGVMLDTANKHESRLLGQQSITYLAQFVQHGRALGLLTGLAGSLTLEDISVLIESAAPDYLGFRSALCNSHQRTKTLDPKKINTIQNALRQYSQKNATLPRSLVSASSEASYAKYAYHKIC